MAKAFFKFMAWYQTLDKQTLDLLTRVFMKGISTGDLNKFIKQMCARELGEEVSETRVRVIEAEHEEPPVSTQR